MNSPTVFRRGSRLVLAAFLATTACIAGSGQAHAERPFPGPNGAILYGNGGRIYRVNPDGTGNIALTPSGPGDSGPAWSPDGTRIAFDRCLASGGCSAHIWVMNADGSGAHAITSGYNDFNAVWSPDGTRIAYTASGDVGNNWFELRMMNADGSGNHRLAGSYDEHVTRIASVTFSPDGRQILFERQTNITGGTWVIGSNGKDAHVVPNVLARPSWSPDGTQIVSDGGIGSDVWLTAADGSGATNLTKTSDSFEVSPHFSPDGSSILFNRINISYTEGDAIRYDIATGLEHNLTNTPGVMDGAFGWSPDGQKILGTGQGDLFVMDKDGANIVPLGPGSASDWQRVCTITGTDASESITGTSGRDVICAGAGDDTIDGGDGDDVVFGGEGDDRLLGGSGDDVLAGQAGNDTILPGPGNDFIAGDVGIDAVSFSQADVGIVASLASGIAKGEGADWIISVERLIGSAKGDSLTGSRKADALSGGAGNDHLYGGNGADRLSGGAGSDALYGGDGADHLLGADGRDTLRGQRGNDTLNGGPMRDVCVQGPGTGARIACEA